eukprot:gb/GECG01002125.1/.p1 GENE.gb/GECG01002125.1/~~gb/GECG01002125.1/.p1  ORF type:complete len:640 (+),score=71.13 gb/GECG01002125.1/:1-1920(+)
MNSSSNRGSRGRGRGLSIDTDAANISAVNPMMGRLARSASSGSRGDKRPQPSPSGASLRNVTGGRGTPRNRPRGQPPLTRAPLKQRPVGGTSMRSVTRGTKGQNGDASDEPSKQKNGTSRFNSFRNVVLDSGMAPESPRTPPQTKNNKTFRQMVMGALSSKSFRSMMPGFVDKGSSGQDGEDRERSASSGPSSPTTPKSPKRQASEEEEQVDGWCATDDIESGGIYYFHGTTKEVSWEPPEGEQSIAWIVKDDDPNRRLIGKLGMPRTHDCVVDGWIVKSDPKGRHWKTRWIEIVLNSRMIRWYKNNPTSSLMQYNVTEPALGEVSLVGAAIKHRSETDMLHGIAYYVLDIEARDRTLHLIPDSILCLLRWEELIREAKSGDIETGAQEDDVSNITLRDIPPTSAKGWLKKTAPSHKSWRDRFVVIDKDTGLLTYSEKESGKVKGIVNLRNAYVGVGLDDELASIIKSDKRRFAAFHVVPKTPVTGQVSRAFTFVTETTQELDQWVNVANAVAMKWNKDTEDSAEGRDESKRKDEHPGSDSAKVNPLHGSATSLKVGWLHKCDPFGKNWKQRYVRLTPQRMEYFKRKQDATPAGVLELHRAKYAILRCVCVFVMIVAYVTTCFTIDYWCGAGLALGVLH